MRTGKQADARKNEILAAAETLFAKRGYDHTSVADIMDAVGIAKGTLYHHFKSKEEIMDALIERQTSQVLSAAREVAGDQSIPVKERMLRTILALRVDTRQAKGKEMMEQLHKPQNALMHQKTRQVILQSVPPMMAGMVREGMEQGLFKTPYPLECMEMSLCYLDTVLDDDVFALTQEQRQQKIRAFLCLWERLLGAGEGELACFEAAFAKGKCEI